MSSRESDKHHVAREIARLHHGEIEVESRIGEGSIFTLRLPIGGESKSGLRPIG